MIPLIVHHRIVDPFDVTLKACAEEWQQNMNARLVYDFVLLFVLFIIPLTLMTYCYIRISFSLWFIDSNVRSSIASSLSSSLHPARISNLSDELQQLDVNEGRLFPSQKNRPYYIHYHKNFDHDSKRKTQQHPLQQDEEAEELHSLMNPSGSKSGIDPSRRNVNMNETKPKSFSITATTITTVGTRSRRSSSLIGRRLGDNGYESMNLNKPIVGQARATPIGNRSSSSPYHSAIVRSSLTSLPSHHRIHGSTSLSINGNTNRSIVDFERASRFLQSRRRVVKLLITLGKNKSFVSEVHLCFVFSVSFFISRRIFHHKIAVAYFINLYRHYIEHISSIKYLQKYESIWNYRRSCSNPILKCGFYRKKNGFSSLC